MPFYRFVLAYLRWAVESLAFRLLRSPGTDPDSSFVIFLIFTFLCIRFFSLFFLFRCLLATFSYTRRRHAIENNHLYTHPFQALILGDLTFFALHKTLKRSFRNSQISGTASYAKNPARGPFIEAILLTSFCLAGEVVHFYVYFDGHVHFVARQERWVSRVRRFAENCCPTRHVSAEAMRENLFIRIVAVKKRKRTYARAHTTCSSRFPFLPNCLRRYGARFPSEIRTIRKKRGQSFV